MSDLEDRVVAEAAKLVAKEIELNMEELTVLVAEIVASDYRLTSTGRSKATLLHKNAEKAVQEIMRKDILHA